MELIKSNEPLVQSKPLKIVISSPKSLYCAGHFNDDTNTRFFDRIFGGLKVGTGINPDENQQRAVLDEVVHLCLCEIQGSGRTLISVPVLINNKKHTLLLQEMNGIAVIGFAEENNGNNHASKAQLANLRSLDMSFAELKEKLAAQIAHALSDSVEELSTPSHCLAWAEMKPVEENKTEITYHENLNPDYADFAEISVGNSEDKSLTTTDTGTMTKCDGMLATTVVDGGVQKLMNRSVPLVQLPAYSAVITTAELHTVERGILTLGLEGERLQTFFFETVKLLLQAQKIDIDLDEWPAFNGVVFYQEAGVFGVHKKVEFGNDVAGVKVNVVDTVPDEGFNKGNKYAYLTATRNVEDHVALHVSIDVFKFVAGKDDFIVFPLSGNSSRYRHVESPYPREIAKLNLNFVETKEEKKHRLLVEQKKERAIQRAEKSRILTNNTADIFVTELKEFAEEYDGLEFHPDEKFNQHIQAIKDLKGPKIRLLEKQNELAQLEKLSSSEPKLVQAQEEVQLLNNKIFVQQKKVLDILVQRDRVQEKLEKNLLQLKKELEQKKNELVIPEKSEQQQHEVQALQNEVFKQQKKVDAILKKKKILIQELDKQKKIDETLAQRDAEKIKKELARKIDQVRSEEKKEKLAKSWQQDKADDEV